MKKIVVIGLGNVGVCYVYSLINQGINVDEIAIIDLNKNKTKGEILDFNHSLPYLNSKIKIYKGTYNDCKDANIIVITAGARQELGETRMDLIFKNAKIFKDIVKNVMESGFNGIFLNATNPLDVMTQLIYEYSKYSQNKIIGSGTSLDTSRLKYELNKIYNVGYENIQAYVLGEHGDSSTIPWNQATINNIKIALSDVEKNAIECNVRKAGYELLNTKGYSSQAIGMCLVDITSAILNDENREMCLSIYDEESNTYYGYPAIIGKNGIVDKKILSLTREEQNELNNSIKVIKEAVNKVN